MMVSKESLNAKTFIVADAAMQRKETDKSKSDSNNNNNNNNSNKAIVSRSN